ncbi:MAG: quinol:cytochrome C oxidoreductase [Bacteroidetes bacterium]|nr:MAG: quinol:cytochrome C oxidoreductase [Bacteroidota bacterium]REK34771.1 MAG: quinol:cytochrome C oxidoreductase [Bacteroidota bacterium]REK51350.1 MAG: quinol:cytochrome C oxidoreductase [Bacteroidota bacterium]
MMDRKYELTQNNKVIPLIMMAVGVVAIVMGFMTDHYRAWATLLHNNFYFTAIALCGTFFVAVQYVAQAGWATGIKRVPEAMGAYLKYGMAFMLVIFIFGHHDLYHWTHKELYDPSSDKYDPILDGKKGFLNVPFYVIRLIAYAAIWVGFTYLLRKQSLLEDQNGGLEPYNKSVVLGAVFIVLFGVTSSTSAWDFLMSIDSHWFSTLFGWYTFAGLFVSGLAMMALFILVLRKKGYMPHVNENHLHDVGKFMFAFSVFWTYLWFSQFMLIWYAHLPEEVVYYQVRWEYFKNLWVANLLINFIAPFLVLMTRDAKRQSAILWVAGIIILAGHWLDVYLMVTPGVLGKDWQLGFIEVGTMVGFLGLFLRTTFVELSKAPIVPQNHPMLQESLHHHI